LSAAPLENLPQWLAREVFLIEEPMSAAIGASSR
jgi:actin-like ATPase involved in cell morphogenesis